MYKEDMIDLLTLDRLFKINKDIDDFPACLDVINNV